MDSVTRLQKILICSDLDRTIIPNGYQEESAPARPVLRRLAEQDNIYLAYVSGRDRKLILDAIEEFYLPMPDFAIGDVGTSLYRVINGNWQLSEDWSNEIARDWKGLSWEGLAEFLEDIEDMRLQEPEKQNRYKLSFYTDPDVAHQQLMKNIHFVLAEKRVRASIIWSVDEISANGLLDIIPARACKLHAIQFLMQHEQFRAHRTVFAGDSGNDLDVLTSGLQAILVKNATDEVRKETIETLLRQRLTNCLYLPKGNFYGMNGNYAAGLIEGLVHFIPETGELIARAVEISNKPHNSKSKNISFTFE
ncbi:MAG: HAD-IIB family hydrolase [Deltaproteobacteria bacterium]|nr:HAD-IIB family hydrolase [Deltaproteobacteria bacterium]